MIQFQHNLITVLALFAVAISAHSQLAAQEQFIGDGQAVNRVIKLRSQPKKQQTKPKPVQKTTSRGDRVARQTNPVANPNQIQFDEIQVPQALQHQVRPVVHENTTPVRQHSILHAKDQQFAPMPVAALAIPNKPKQESTQPKKPTETVSFGKNMIATEIRSPSSVNVSQPAQMTINLSNLGQESVDNVTLIARIPDHAKFVSATPRPAKVEGQTYQFTVPRIGGEQTQQVVINVVPTKKAPLEIGTQVVVENVHRTVVGVVQPELSMSLKGPSQATTGKVVMHSLMITNTGDGVATDVKLDAMFPAGLKRTQHSNATLIPTIKPGASLEIPFESRALSPGKGQLKIVANSKDAETKEATMEVAVFEPELRLSAVGPKLNFVQRDGIYTIDIENTGEVEVSNVQVSLAVPSGMKVTTISRQANYDEQRGTLSWGFESLAAKSKEQIQLKATAIEEGQQVCHIHVSSNETLEKEFQLATMVTTRADLSIRIKNQSGPVQVGSKAEFIVEVENQGSRQATGVNVHVALPESLMPVNDGKNATEIQNALMFNEPLVAPGQKVTFKFTAVGVSKGDHVVRGTLQADGSERKVITENSVYVYELAEARVSEELSPAVSR